MAFRIAPNYNRDLLILPGYNTIREYDVQGNQVILINWLIPSNNTFYIPIMNSNEKP